MVLSLELELTKRTNGLAIGIFRASILIYVLSETNDDNHSCTAHSSLRTTVGTLSRPVQEQEMLRSRLKYGVRSMDMELAYSTHLQLNGFQACFVPGLVCSARPVTSTCRKALVANTKINFTSGLAPSEFSPFDVEGRGGRLVP